MQKWIAATALLAAAPLAIAQPPERDELRLDALIDAAIRTDPELLAQQKRVEAMRQRPRQEGALPDAMLSLGYASSGGPLPGQGLGRDPTSNIGFMVTQDLPYPGKRGLMAGIASKEADAELEQYRIAERSIIARVKRAYHRLDHAYESIEVMESGRTQLTNLIALTRARYSTGQAAQQEIFKAQTSLALMEAKIIKMRQEQSWAQAEINSLIGQPVSTPLARPHHIEPRVLSASLDELLAAADNTSPMLAKEQKMAEARQIGVSLARKNFYPDFAISGGYFNMGTMPDMYQFRLDIKIPRGSRGRAALAEQVHSLDQARKSYQAEERDIHWRVSERYTTAQTSWQLLKIYEDTVVPQADLAVESALASYGSGTLDSLPVLMNLMTSIEQGEQYHEEMLNYFEAVIGLEELTGLELL